MVKQRELLKYKDWECLILLDACRYDLSKGIFDKSLTGKLIPVDSESCNTNQWYKLNWNNKSEDIILVSASPVPWRWGNVNYVHNRKFFRSIPVWKEDDWLEPSVCLNKAIEIQEKFNKKLLVHLIPPHLPYLGNKGKKFLKSIGTRCELTTDVYKNVSNYGKKFGWKIPKECYMENIEYVLNKIKDKLSLLKGKIIITSDHGEIIVPNFYNHNKFEQDINMVPWFEMK